MRTWDADPNNFNRYLVDLWIPRRVLNSGACNSWDPVPNVTPNVALVVLLWCSLKVHSILMKPKVSNGTQGHQKTTSTHQACRLGHILYLSVSSQVVGFSKVIWVSFTSDTCSLHSHVWSAACIHILQFLRLLWDVLKGHALVFHWSVTCVAFLFHNSEV